MEKFLKTASPLSPMSPAEGTVQELIADLERHGCRLWAEGGRLHVDAPRQVLTAERRALLAAHKGALLAALAGSPPAAPEPDAGPDLGAEAEWVGQRVRIEDLADFKRRYGLRTVGSEWPERAERPVVTMVETGGLDSGWRR